MLAAEPPESLHLDALAQQVLHCIEPAAADFRQVYCAEASLGDLLQDEHLLVSHLGSGTYFHGAPCSWHVRHAGLGDVED